MSKEQKPAYDVKEVQRVDKIIFECELNITSPYNSGYQIDWYKEQIKKYKDLKKRRGTQLEFNFE